MMTNFDIGMGYSAKFQVQIFKFSYKNSYTCISFSFLYSRLKDQEYMDSLSQFRSLNYTRSPLFRKNFEQMFLNSSATTLALACSGTGLT